MKIHLPLLALLVAVPLAAPLAAQAAPKRTISTSAIRHALGSSIKSSLGSTQITKSGIDGETGPTFRIDGATQTTMLAAASHMSATKAPFKAFNRPIANFSRGAKISKVAVRGKAPAGKTYRLPTRVASNLRSGLSVSNLRKLAMIKTF